MLKSTFVTREETALPGHKAMKDIALLLYGNDSNNCEGTYLIMGHEKTLTILV